MAVRPKRKNPISTRPIYLPRVPAKELREAAKASAPMEGAGLRIYVDGAPPGLDIEGLAERLGRAQTSPVAIGGELVSILAGRPHGEVRDAVADAANRLAWARIGDPEKQNYRVLPLRGEVDQEEARLHARPFPEYKGAAAPPPQAGLLYEGAEVQAAFRELIASAGEGINVIVTGRRLSSWDASAKKWAPRAVLVGDPVLVSASGGDANGEALAAEIGRALAKGGGK